MKYAIIDANNIAVNFIAWDGVSPYNPGEGLFIVEFDDTVSYNFGWIYDPITKQFSDPNPPPAEDPPAA